MQLRAGPVQRHSPRTLSHHTGNYTLHVHRLLPALFVGLGLRQDVLCAFPEQVLRCEVAALACHEHDAFLLRLCDHQNLHGSLLLLWYAW